MGVEPHGSAGYSQTSLAKKLGLKEGSSLLLLEPPSGWIVAGTPAGTKVLRGRITSRKVEQADVVIAFFRQADQLMHDAASLAARLVPGSSLWIAWPRRAGGHVSDITDNLLRQVLLPAGVVDVKVAALDDDWSGLKFVRRKS